MDVREKLVELHAAATAAERRMIMALDSGYFEVSNPVKTNAERIRSMSDEELKKFICSMFKCEFCDFELGERCGLLNWLQMPAEEADNETD